MKKKLINLVVVLMTVVVLLCGCGRNVGENEVLMRLEGDSPQTSYETREADWEVEADIYVYICGAVQNAGVYKVAGGSRLYEVVELAGGFTQDADETCLNLAREVTDGEQLVIRTKQEMEADAEAQRAAESGLVNINTASVAELTTISGIGESRAKAIIAYRDANGGFKSIEDIKNVDGIKDGLFSKIKDKITV